MTKTISAPTKNNCMEIGFVKKKFSHQGKFILQLNSPLFELKSSTEFIFFEYENCLIPYKIIELIQKNELEFLVQLKNIVSENDLLPFLESEVWIEKTKIKKLKNKEFDLSKLIGFSVFNKNTGLIGVLHEIQENKFQQLMKIKTSENKEILIPFVEEFILEINSKNKIIELDLPAGLLEMND
jgi:16S rRNA processing protein RimM